MLPFLPQKISFLLFMQSIKTRKKRNSTKKISHSPVSSEFECARWLQIGEIGSGLGEISLEILKTHYRFGNCNVYFNNWWVIDRLVKSITRRKGARCNGFLSAYLLISQDIWIFHYNTFPWVLPFLVCGLHSKMDRNTQNFPLK